MADFIVSPPEPTDWKLPPDALADSILSRWPDAETGRRERSAHHEALAFRLRVAEKEISGDVVLTERDLVERFEAGAG